MKFPFRRRLALGAAAACLLGAAVTPSQAGTWPERPITLYVGFAPGGAADIVARVLSDDLSKRLGQRVIIENKSGAGGNLATQAVVSQPADGYSVLLAAINLATNPALMGVKYDPATDLQMVAQVTSVPVVMLVPATGKLKSPADVIAAGRIEPGLKVGSGGNGTSSHLAAELFSRAEKVRILHVPYRGGAPANQALMGGEIDLMFDLMSGSLKSLVDGQRIRPLAVMQDSRIATLPNVPSAKELGLDSSTYIRSWQGLAVRSGTPADIVDKLHAATVAAANSPQVRERIEQLGSEVTTGRSPAEFQQLYRAELVRWTGIIKAANIRTE